MLERGKVRAWVGALGVMAALAAWAPVRGDSPGTFVPVGRMTQARALPKVTLLLDGTVLVTGGFALKENPANPWGDWVPLASAERFDPTTGRFTALPPMAETREDSQPTARLMDGRVLIVSRGDSHLTEIFDPVIGQFSRTGDMIHLRGGPTATLLPDGQVLVAGGWDGGNGPSKTAELFDPATGKFAITGSMATPRYRHAAVGLPDGRVIILGGASTGNVAQRSVEIYDPKTGGFSLAGQMAETRVDLAAVLLRDGRVLVLGGHHKDADGNEVLVEKNAEIYDPAAGQSVVVEALSDAPPFAIPVGLRDGRILIAGGYSGQPGEDPSAANFLRSALLFDPASGGVSPAASMSVGRSTGAGVLLSDGRALILGGDTWNGGYAFTDTAELFAP